MILEPGEGFVLVLEEGEKLISPRGWGEGGDVFVSRSSHAIYDIQYGYGKAIKCIPMQISEIVNDYQEPAGTFDPVEFRPHRYERIYPNDRPRDPKYANGRADYVFVRAGVMQV
jgi:hypothetical protein